MRARSVIAAAVLSGAAPALAQHSLWSGQTLPGLKRVDEGSGDVGPLAKSQRLVPIDLRVPTGFEGVYSFERPGPLGKPETMFMRMDGGLAAVFPRSIYVEGPGGLVPQVPAGTVYVLGMPDVVPPTKAKPRAPEPEPPVLRPSPPPRMSIWSDDNYRKQAVGELMGRLSPK